LSTDDPSCAGDAQARQTPPRIFAGRPALQPLARALSGHLSASISIEADERVGTLAGYGGPLVILLDAPDAASAQMLQDGEVDDVQMALLSWAADATSALQRWRAAPDQVLLAEGLASTALAAIWRWRPDLRATAPKDAPQDSETSPEVDPALVALAGRTCRRQPGLATLTADLAAAGLVFTDRSLRSDGVALVDEEGAETFWSVGNGDTATLQQCLSDTQLELEATHLRLHDAMSELAARSLTSGSNVRPIDARLQWDDPTTPEAMVLVTVRELEIVGLRRLPRVRAALRLERGEPELRLFAAGSDPEVLSAWHPDGTASGLAYMRFRPADEEARQRLQRLGSADWQTVSVFIALMQRETDRVGDLLPRPWRVAMARLRRQIAVLPPRFRYDALRIVDGSDGDRRLALHFDGASFGSARLGPVHLDWTDKKLCWILEDDGVDLPLASWPLDGDGMPAARWALPVGGADLSDPDKQVAWRALADDDRALVLAVLDALPAVAGCVTDAQAERQGGRAALSAAAAQPLREALRLLSQDRQRLRLARIPGLRWLRR
jgi:hypothetical protein